MLEEVGDGSAASSANLIRVGEEFPTRVSLKVQDGCNHSCTYCIVHVARGKAWSRPIYAVLEEALALADAGVKELVLTGIDLGSYCYTEGEKRIRLGALVRRMLDELSKAGHDDVRLRVGSARLASRRFMYFGSLAERVRQRQVAPIRFQLKQKNVVRMN